MNTLHIFTNVLQPADCQTFECEDIANQMQLVFGETLPDTARVYHGLVCHENDVTPHDQASIEHLLNLEGEFSVVVYPKFFLLGGLLGGNLFAVLLLGVLAYLLRPTPPEQKNTGNDSPNNGLSDRQNRPRPNARIPDIFGTVRSTPDLISEPWHEYVNHRQIEHVYLCVGRGSYEIDDVKDGETLISDISGIDYAIYGPNTSPHSGVAEVVFGQAIGERVWTSLQSNTVDGQILRAPNSVEIDGENDIAYNDPDQIVTTNSDRNFEEYFAEGDVITLTDSQTGNNSGGPNLDGTYTILSVTETSLVLANPGSVNSEWDTAFGSSATSNATITSSSDKWVGPIAIEDAYDVAINIVAPQGLYMVTSTGKQKTIGVDFEARYTETDKDGVPIAPPVVTPITRISGSDELQNQRSGTLRFTLPVTIANFKGRRWDIELRRVTDREDVSDDERLVDQCQWETLFALGYVDKDDFGLNTTVQLRTAATSSALSVKERKWNCRATRKLIRRTSDLGVSPITFSVGEEPTQSAGDIVRHIALDQTLGNMTEQQIDYDSIYGAVDENILYFGTELTSQFNHTFDDKDKSAEEMLVAVAKAAHCYIYRQGGELKMSLEKATNMSTILFNHRNKIPGSELRTISFGYNEDYDGIDLDWIDPDTGVVNTYRVPLDLTAINPKKVETEGIQTEEQAHIHAHREYHKILYRREAVEFDATQEAFALVRGDRIEVSDNTRPKTFDGEIVSQDGMIVQLSQPFEPEDGVDYVMQLQLFDKQVQVIDIQATGNEYYVVLQQAPIRQLITYESAVNKYAKTAYQIIASDTYRTSAFILQELRPEDNFTCQVRASNYDARYYQNDGDINAGIFTGGETVSIVFRENWESIEVTAGNFVLVSNPGNFQSSGPIEIQNNVPGVGPAAEGSKHAELDGLNELTADVVTDPAKFYDLLIWYSGRPGVDSANNEIDLYWDGVLITTFAIDMTGEASLNWQTFFLELPQPATALTQLRLVSTTDTDVGRGGMIDDIRIRESDGNQTPPFNPLNIPSIWTWLDNVEANFDLDPAGGNIDEVDRWYDQSGLASPHDAFQNTNSFRPLFVRDAVNGDHVIFRGNSGNLGSNAADFFFLDNVDTGAGPSSYSIYLVCEIDASLTDELSALISSDDSAGPDSHIYFAPGGETGETHGISMDGNAVPDVGRWFVNGVDKGFGIGAGVPGDIVTGTKQLHSVIMDVAQTPWEILGALEEGGGTPNVGFRGKMYEVLIYQGKHNATIRQAIEAYLTEKHSV